MKIASLRECIDFEGRKLHQDEIGNEFSTWEPLFSRWCSYKRLRIKEEGKKGTSDTKETFLFTLRYEKALLDLDSHLTHIRFKDGIYDIKTLDDTDPSKQLILIYALKEESHDQGSS